jgi:hypothetical protein
MRLAALALLFLPTAFAASIVFEGHKVYYEDRR